MALLSYHTACNIGSTANRDNSNSTGAMPSENRFQYNTAPAYTCIPCYSHPTYFTLHPSPDSSGRCTSIIDSIYYYPAIATYGIEYWYKL